MNLFGERANSTHRYGVSSGAGRTTLVLLEFEQLFGWMRLQDQAGPVFSLNWMLCRVLRSIIRSHLLSRVAKPVVLPNEGS
jgi:hypothetical protein